MSGLEVPLIIGASDVSLKLIEKYLEDRKVQLENNERS
jgi:hypothetical protein